MGFLRIAGTAVLVSVLTVLPSLASASAPAGSDPVIAEWPHWPYPVSCGGAPFDPVDVFSGPARAESGSQPSAMGLREVLADPSLTWLGFSATGWRLTAESATEATYIAGRTGSGLERLSLELTDGKWKLAGSGTCTLHSTAANRVIVSWRLAEDQPALTSDTKRLRIIFSGGPCNSGQPFVPHKPAFRQLGRRLLMTIAIVPPSPGPKTCQGIVQPPFTVSLPKRLGDRKLFDGSTYPPLSAAETRLFPGR